MTAEAIHNRIHGEGYCFPPCGLCLEVEDLLASHAHELAEKIRAEIKDPNPLASVFQPFAGTLAADLIDPEVET